MNECSSFPINITFSQEHICLVFLIFQRGHLLLKESSAIDKSFNNERESINSSINNFVKILSTIPLFSFGQRTPNPIKFSLQTKCMLKGKKYLTLWCNLLKAPPPPKKILLDISVKHHTAKTSDITYVGFFFITHFLVPMNSILYFVAS